MKMKNMLGGVVAVAVALVAGSAGAQNLSHNAGSTLTLTGDVSYANVLVGHQGGSTATIVDATGTTNFTSNGTQFYVGTNSGTGTGIGTINLGILNSITANQVTIGGAQPDNNNNTGNAGRVTTLANGTTTINAGNMAVGTGKGTGTILGQTGGRFILGSGATLNMYGLTGSGSRAELVVGRWAAFNAHSGNGGMDLSAGVANLHLSALQIGHVTSSSGGSGNIVTGLMTLGTNASNHLNVSGAGSVVRIGYNNQSGGNGITSNGTLTIGNLNSTSSVTSTDNSTAILIGYRGGAGQTANGTLNMNGGTLKITTTGTAIQGAAGTAGAGTSTLNLSGGAKLIAGSDSTNWIHSLSTATIGAGGATIDTDGKTIGISQAFSGAGGLTKDGAGTLTLSGTQTYGGGTTVSAGRLVVNGALGAGAVTVADGAALGGTGTINGDVTFAAGAKFYYDWQFDTGLIIGAGKKATFGGFSIANLLGVDWDMVDLDTPITLVHGTVDFANSTIANFGLANAADVGTNRKAYFKEGSLQLVVIPEPATFGIVLSVLAAAVIRRKRFG
jgi:fibronectin-binding autotransporter adhesin